MNRVRAVLALMGATIAEYLRSLRWLVEFGLAALAYVLYFRQPGLDAQGFTTGLHLFGGICVAVAAQGIYAMADREQGMLLLTRRIGRSGYLLAHLLTVVIIAIAGCGLLSAAVALTAPVAGLTLADWGFAVLPLVLNIVLLAAMVLLLTPLVLAPGWRLLILLAAMLAFSGTLIGGQTLAALPAPLVLLLDVLRTIFAVPLLPFFSGYEIGVTGDRANAPVLLATQSLMALGLVALVLTIFARRDLRLGRV